MQDRVFLGGDCWANPMEDWQVVDGAAECGNSYGNRNVHLLTHQLTNVNGQFQMSVVLDQVENRALALDTGAGFKIGIRSDINEYRSNSFAKNGLRAGIADGKLVLGEQVKAVAGLTRAKNLTLRLIGSPNAAGGGAHELTIVATGADGLELVMVTMDTEAKTYYLESFQFLVDATDRKATNQFAGWPVTIQQKENGGDNIIK